jgi:hypothetical protein
MEPELAPNVRSYYERGNEAKRLHGAFPSGPLELARTKEIVSRCCIDKQETDLFIGGARALIWPMISANGHTFSPTRRLKPVEGTSQRFRKKTTAKIMPLVWAFNATRLGEGLFSDRFPGK